MSKIANPTMNEIKVFAAMLLGGGQGCAINSDAVVPTEKIRAIFRKFEAAGLVISTPAPPARTNYASRMRRTYTLTELGRENAEEVMRSLNIDAVRQKLADARATSKAVL